jgi:D-arabinose 1-dehydrogenase-like Zn-dependent alcohol dehydrogenase
MMSFCMPQCGIPGGGAVIELDLQDAVFGQKAMAGSIVGGRADMAEMLQFCAEKGVAPMVEVMKLSQVGLAGFAHRDLISAVRRFSAVKFILQKHHNKPVGSTSLFQKCLS